MSQPTERTLVMSSQTSSGPSPRREKVDFPHYGFLLVDSWCAYGVPAECLVSMRDSLATDSGPFLDSIKDVEKEQNPELTYEDSRKAGEKGFPRGGQRVLEKWPVNSLWSEFLVDMGIRDADAQTAKEQVEAFVAAKGWQGQDSTMHAFMCSLQLWYYGYPTDKV